MDKKQDDKSIWHRPSWLPRWVSLTLVLVVVGAIHLLFFYDYNLFKSLDYDKQIADLNSRIQASKDTTKYYEHKILELRTDKETLERIAREKYGMKSENEEVYVIKK